MNTTNIFGFFNNPFINQSSTTNNLTNGLSDELLSSMSIDNTLSPMEVELPENLSQIDNISTTGNDISENNSLSPMDIDNHDTMPMNTSL